MAEIPDILITAQPLPAVVLSPEQEAVRRKFAMANGNLDLVELTLHEFAAYRGQSLESVRKNLRRMRCVRRLTQKDTTIHLGTWHEEQQRMRAGGL